ncbi:MAG TPA: DUF1592 domain-containing protein [Polyangia bacterium]|nr:DUF1592 domain-containing protein [Polyangia bacterium]
MGGQPSTASPSSLISLSGGDLPAPRIHKLTATEFANSVHDLLGDAAPLGPVEPDTTIGFGFTSAAASVATVSPDGVAQYETATGAATDYAFGDPARAAALLPCMPSGPTDQACMKQALAAIGRRAFRRPLTDAEQARYVTLASTIAGNPGNTALTGLRHAVWAILQSPSFIYRVELGTASQADGGRLKFNDFEMASRLAGALWASVPDDMLLDAAAQGQLSSADGVKAQAQRMLADARVHRAFTSFVADLYDKTELDQANKDPMLYPTFTTTLKAAMQQELEQRIDDVVFGAGGGDYLSLLDGKTAFVNNELAAHYGLPAVTPDAWRKVTLPDSSHRVGLLGAGAILAGQALPQRTSPTARGKFVNEALLCRVIPPPPDKVPPLPDETDQPNTTVRQRLVKHRQDPSCAACHALMDPIGFGMENFDTVGKYRTTDNNQPIDATGTLGGMNFDGLGQLGGVLRQQPASAPCLVSKVYSYLLGRTINDKDASTIDALATFFGGNGNNVDKLLLQTVTSDAFRFVQPVKP